MRGTSPDDEKLTPMLTVLVVEDDEYQRRGLELGLGHLGHLVLSASCVGQVPEMLETFQIDLILCDHALPDGTSNDVIRSATTLAPKVPAILMTGVLKDEQEVAAAVSQGFTCCLMKPLDTARLQRAAWKALGRPF